jgi:hypothetical protein
MEKDSKKQREEFARRLADKEANKIRVKAFLIDLNAPETSYQYKRTRIASK